MIEKELIKGVRDRYVRAFVAVAKILVPTIKVTEIKAETIINETSRTHNVIVKGVDELNGCNVIVYTEQTNEGLQLAVKYVLPNGEPLFVRRVWYYSFNWKGLMACS